MNPKLLRALVASFFVLLAACRSTSTSAPSETYQLAFLVRGPSTTQRTQEERNQLQAAHMANIQKLADEKKLLIAGPFGDGNPHPETRGIFLFDTRAAATAREWTSTDPAVQAGTLAMELATLRSSSPLKHAYELELAMRAELKARGEEPRMETTIRGYVMLLARDAAAAERGLASTRAAGKVLFEGRLEDSARANYVAVLDAETVDAATALLGTAALGEHELVSWWSTRALTGLAR